jgi:hypothetical protein
VQRIFQTCLVIGCVLILLSCSIIDSAYNNAPVIIANEFDNAFDLSDEQQNLLDSRLQPLLAWHRQHELPRYQQLLEQAARSADDGIEATEFLTLQREAHLAWQRILEKSIDSLGDLVTTLSPEQIENYRQYDREHSEEFDDYLKKSQQQREIHRSERSYDRLSSWFGGFDSSQEERVRARLQQLPDIYEPWYRYRQARQQALFEIFTAKLASDLTRQRLKAILLGSATAYARTFEAERRAYGQAYALALEDISGWLTRAQRHRAAERLREYARVAARLQQLD